MFGLMMAISNFVHTSGSLYVKEGLLACFCVVCPSEQ